MSTKSTDARDRLPTAGPATGDYERYTSVEVDDDLILYDIESKDAWMQSATSYALDAWR